MFIEPGIKNEVIQLGAASPGMPRQVDFEGVPQRAINITLLRS
jgi:hypothetical protein